MTALDDRKATSTTHLTIDGTEIEVPKGTKAAYIDAIHRRSNGEAEVLLQRKTTFKVLGVRQEGGYTIVRTRVERQG